MISAKRILSLVLVLACLLTLAPAVHAEEAEAPVEDTEVQEETGFPEELYLTQEMSGTCTLCSATMMVRACMYLHGSESWPSVTESVMRRVAWYNGVGLKWNFEYTDGDCVVKVAHMGVDGFTVEELKALLDEHPEGIVFYCGNLPHAVFLTDYEGDTFYCAETVAYYSGARIPLEDSWIGRKYGSQETALARATSYWYVEEYIGGDGFAPCGCSNAYAGSYTCATAETDLLIREGHGTDYPVVGRIPSGATVEVSFASGEGEDQWAHVTYGDVSGYCAMAYLEKIMPTYTVSYDANGGTGAPEAQEKEHDVSLILREEMPAKDQSVFLGWASTADAAEAEYTPSDEFTENSDTTLYAVWRQVCPDGHSYESVVYDPTCEIPGYTLHVCVNCGTSRMDAYVDALDHEYGAWAVTRISTASAPGEKARVCGRCGDTDTCEIPAVSADTELDNPFTDVSDDAFYHAPVLWAYHNGITTGKSANEFDPQGTCTRKQIVMFLWRANGCPEPDSMVNPFSDVPVGDFYEKAVLWAYYEGITTGRSETVFDPDAPCTRDQIVMFLWRSFGKPEPAVTENPFTDVPDDIYREAILWAYGAGITTGKTADTFQPKATCTRGQIVTFLYRAMAESE